MNRKMFLISLVVAICIATIAVLLLLMPGKDNRTASSTTRAQAPDGILISNASQYSSDVEQETVPSVAKALYKRIRESTKQPAAAYTATVRQGSLSRTYDDYEVSTVPIQVPTTTFLVDIPDAQRTYRVSISGGLNYPYNILYVLCPTTNENRYAPFTCSDESS